MFFKKYFIKKYIILIKHIYLFIFKARFPTILVSLFVKLSFLHLLRLYVELKIKVWARTLNFIDWALYEAEEAGHELQQILFIICISDVR